MLPVCFPPVWLAALIVFTCGWLSAPVLCFQLSLICKFVSSSPYIVLPLQNHPVLILSDILLSDPSFWPFLLMCVFYLFLYFDKYPASNSEIRGPSETKPRAARLVWHCRLVLFNSSYEQRKGCENKCPQRLDICGVFPTEVTGVKALTIGYA